MSSSPAAHPVWATPRTHARRARGRSTAIDVNKPSVPHAAYYETDLRDPAAIDDTVTRVNAAGPIDRLFNCAGVPHTTGPLNCMLVNWVGLRYLTEGLLPNIVDGGAIASISSDAGIAYQANLETVHELLAVADPVEAKAWCEAHPESIPRGTPSPRSASSCGR